MFLTGFIFATVIVYLICIQEKLLPTYANLGNLYSFVAWHEQKTIFSLEDCLHTVCKQL